MAVLLTFFSGFTIVLARITNAKLGERSGLVFSSLMNYVVGLLGSLLLYFIAGAPLLTAFPNTEASFTVYLGGAMGLCSIYLCNVITPKLPAIQLTLLLFLGQLFSGMLIDYFTLHIFSPGKLVGGVLVLCGMLLNISADKEREKAA